MSDHISREDALSLVKAHNKEPFHIQHALTVEGVMRWYAEELGFAEEHCIKAPEILHEAGVDEDIIHGVCSHGYGITVDVEPEHLMEKVLYATDELTGLIGAAALMRPSKSVQDMEVKSVKKKYKSANFAAGCSREVIERGADMLGWELSDLIQKTILAMRSCEADIAEAMAEEGN